MIMETANVDVDAPSDICRQVEERCLVAKDSPFGPTACGAFGWTYDVANYQLGYYRHYSNWTTFQEWIAANPNVLADEDGTWKSSPRAYFRRCCNEWHAVVQQMEDGTWRPFRAEFYALPWSYAFLWEELRDHPVKFQRLHQGGECPYYLTLAREMMPQSPRQLSWVAGALRWHGPMESVPYIHMAAQLEANAVPNHFAELAKLAVQNDVDNLEFVPGAMVHYDMFHGGPWVYRSVHAGVSDDDLVEIVKAAQEKWPEDVVRPAILHWVPPILQRQLLDVYNVSSANR